MASLRWGCWCVQQCVQAARDAVWQCYGIWHCDDRKVPIVATGSHRYSDRMMVTSHESTKDSSNDGCVMAPILFAWLLAQVFSWHWGKVKTRTPSKPLCTLKICVRKTLSCICHRAGHLWLVCRVMFPWMVYCMIVSTMCIFAGCTSCRVTSLPVAMQTHITSTTCVATSHVHIIFLLDSCVL